MINKPVAAPNPPPLFTRPRPAPRHEDRVVYAIGSKVIVTASSEGQKIVDLMDEKGHPSPLKIKVETRTEVTAWRPQRSGAARYRIRAEDSTEGWIEAANVRRVPPPPRPIVFAPKPVLPAAKPATGKGAAKKAKPTSAKPAGAVTPTVAGKTPTKALAKSPAALAKSPVPRAAAPVPKKPVAAVLKRPAAQPAKPAAAAKKPAPKVTAKPTPKAVPKTIPPAAKKKKK